MSKTAIQWTEETWNPTRGCSIVSPGCKRCYAMNVAGERLSYKGGPYEGLVQKVNDLWAWTGEVRFVAQKLIEPIRRTKPTMFFVNSMSDVFHESIADEQIMAIFGAMAASPKHTFQVLTKRIDRAVDFFTNIHEHVKMGANPISMVTSEAAKQIGATMQTDGHEQRALHDRIAKQSSLATWPLPNVWIGASVEDQRRADERLPMLHRLRDHAAITFVSFEPLLGPVDLSAWIPKPMMRHDDPPPDPPVFDWGIIGGESGVGARPMNVAWAESLIKQMRMIGAAPFMKQLGGEKAKKGALDDFPRSLRVREMPAPRS